MTLAKNNTPLSEDGSFEKIVNEHTQKARYRSKVWFNNTFRTIVILFAIWLVVLLLCKFQVVSLFTTVMVSEIVTCVVSFLAGRLWEQAFK